MGRLFLNRGKYCGEMIDIASVVADIDKACLETGWEARPVVRSPGLNIPAFVRRVPSPRASIYISSGMHGDEPAGPLAIRRTVLENRWPERTEIWMAPCLNPTGFPLNQRENRAGVDLNREYRNPTQAEILAHIGWIGQCPQFAFSVLLHEDWEADGYYLYETNPDNRPSLAEPVIAGVREVCAIQSDGVVDDWHSTGGIIRPNVDPGVRPAWPEALYLSMTKSRLSYTLEAPSDYDLEDRVAAHVAALRTFLTLSEQL